MKAVEFCYWLQGLFELADPKSLSEYQTDLIRRHLSMVFRHEIDPSYPAEQQSRLDELHSGITPVSPLPGSVYPQPLPPSPSTTPAPPAPEEAPSPRDLIKPRC